VINPLNTLRKRLLAYVIMASIIHLQALNGSHYEEMRSMVLLVWLGMVPHVPIHINIRTSGYMYDSHYHDLIRRRPPTP
jgi:hypothetical protein